MDDNDWGTGISVTGANEPANDSTTESNDDWGSGISVEGEDSSNEINIGSIQFSVSSSVHYSITIDGQNYEQVSGQPLRVTATGGTNNSDNGWVSIGADIVNPNYDLLAKSANVEITYKDSYGNVLDVGNEYISYIDPGATFHYGTEHYVGGTGVSQFEVKVYTDEFYRVNKSLLSGCSLKDISRRIDSWGSTELFGSMSNSTYKTINYCNGFVQFLNADGSISGGVSCFVDMIPAGQSRPVKINCSVNVSASKYVTSVIYDL